MNIHISALLQKMEEELKKAKTAQQDEELKQHIAVVRSLCDVVMDNSDTPRSPASPTITASPVAAPAADPMLLEKMMGSAGLSQYRKKEKEKSEEDGNGDSLFDF